MSVKLEGFRALVSKKAGEIKAIGSKQGFEIHAADEALLTEEGRVRVFKNLTTLARFAKAEGCQKITMDLSIMPKGPKTPAKASKRSTAATPLTKVKKVATVA